LVECDRLFPSNDVVPNKFQPGPTDIKNIILDVPTKHVSHIADMTCKNDAKNEETTYLASTLSQVLHLSARNYDVLDNYSPRFNYYLLSQVNKIN
jgi:hypothetical protein